MRENLTAPTLDIPAEEVDSLCALLDGQSRIKLAVWVRHDEGAVHDHHLVLAVDDDDWRTGDMWALEEGMELPRLCPTEQQWLDIFPVSEVETLRAFGNVLWEQTVPGPDPLDYRHTYEPFVPDAEALRDFAARAQDLHVERVEAALHRSWKGDQVIEARPILWVSAPDLQPVMDAARTTVLADYRLNAGHLGAPREDLADKTTVLYEAVA